MCFSWEYELSFIEINTAEHFWNAEYQKGLQGEGKGQFMQQKGSTIWKIKGNSRQYAIYITATFSQMPQIFFSPG